MQRVFPVQLYPCNTCTFTVPNAYASPQPVAVQRLFVWRSQTLPRQHFCGSLARNARPFERLFVIAHNGIYLQRLCSSANKPVFIVCLIGIQCAIYMESGEIYQVKHLYNLSNGGSGILFAHVMSIQSIINLIQRRGQRIHGALGCQHVMQKAALRLQPSAVGSQPQG